MTPRAAFVMAVCFGLASQAQADDPGLGEGAGAFLNFSLGARAIAMGQAQAAVRPEEATVLYANPARLADLSGPSIATTTGVLGLDRSLYFAAYAHPFGIKRGDSEEGGFTLRESELGSLQKTPGAVPLPAGRPSGNEYELLREIYEDKSETSATGGQPLNRPLVATEKIQMAVAAGITMFGIQNIEGRSEFGAPEADFQDMERAIYLAYGVTPYRNWGIGFTGKYISQTLQSASAYGFGFDIGTVYGIPFIRRGRWDLALVAKDLGSSLKWTVPDPALDSESKYKEPVPSKLVLGTAYTSAGERWTTAFDILKARKQEIRTSLGVEWRTLSFLRLRGGLNQLNPSGGFGIDWDLKAMRLKLDYAFQYDIHSLVNPHWFTLSLNF